MAGTDTTRWLSEDVDTAVARSLQDQLSGLSIAIPPAIASLLVSRGIVDGESAERFFRPRLSALSDPLALPGMDAAAKRVWKAVDGGERIAIFGDYDVDGLTASALLCLFFREIGADPFVFIPNRLSDGYGLTTQALQRCVDQGKPSLLITVDCGISSVEAVNWAAEQGIDVIVTDHHEPPESLPDRACAVVNPKLAQDETTRVLSGVGVAFKLAHAILKVGRDDSRQSATAVDLRRRLDLVALGTVADVVPLTGENRILVQHGLETLRNTELPGLRALMDTAGIKGALASHHLGFVLGPRINAAGRLGSAESSFELLTTVDPARARELAGELEGLNSERKRIEDQLRDEAESLIETGGLGGLYGISLYKANWHHGLLGIVASRILARRRRPVALLAGGGHGECRGSCRGPECLNLMDVLKDCSDLLISHGGHRMAAGLRLKETDVCAFAARFDDACRKRLSPDDLRPIQRVDVWLDSLGDADDSLLAACDLLKPTGVGNPAPVWGVKQAQIIGQPRRVGARGQHLQFMVGQGRAQVQAVAFDMADRQLPEPLLDIAFHLQANEFGSMRRLQLNVKNFRASDG